MFTVQINTGGSAFRSEYATTETCESPLDETGAEVVRILSTVQRRLASGESDGKLHDINGNLVGSFSYS